MKVLSLLNGRLLAMLVALTGLVFITSCGDDDGGDDGPVAPTETIWEIVQGRDNLTAMERELEAAGLDDALSGDGPMTLFAPSDAALEALLETLGLQDFSSISEAVANAVLTYHVANSQILAAQLEAGNEIPTLQGEAIEVKAGPTLSSGATSDAGFITTDILATNGVVHILDNVLVPPSIGSLIVATLGTVAQPILLGAEFTTLAAAIQKADTEYAAVTEGVTPLLSILSDRTLQLTVFAPTNEVFEAAQISLDDFSGEQWYGIIANHVAGEIYGTDDLVNGFTFETLANGNTVLVIELPDGTGSFTGIALDSTGDQMPEAEIALPNAAEAGNGLVHAIAGILLLPS